MAKKVELPATFNIDGCYFTKLQTLKEEVKENDIENIFSRLENKEIFILAISIAIKFKLTPQRSKKSNTYFRTETITLSRDPPASSALRSLIYSYSKNLKILLPENALEFYKLAEDLANAGMNETIELLQNKHKIEEMLLKEGSKLCRSIEQED